MKKIIALLIIFFSATCSAKTKINFYGFSLHSKSGFNNFNSGVGIEHSIESNLAIIAGTFNNSINNQSVYGGIKYFLFEHEHIRFNVQGGLITGYGKSNKILPIILPETCLNYSPKSPELCAIIIPPIPNADVIGAIGIYIKIPIN